MDAYVSKYAHTLDMGGLGANVLQAAVALALFYEPINKRIFPVSSATAA